MKILSLEVKNFKGVKHIKVYANPHCNEIAGPNEAGKSSFLDAIPAIFLDAKSLDPMPLNDKALKGKIVLETDTLIAEKRFKENGRPELVAKTKDGSKRGQRDLENMLTDFTFDPLEFSRMKPVELMEAIKKIAGEDFIKDLDAINFNLSEAKAERKLSNRELKKIGQLEEVEEVEPVEVELIADKLKAAEAHNKEQTAKKTAIEFKMEKIRNIQAEIGKLKKLLDINRGELERIPEPAEAMGTDELHQKLAEAGEINRKAQEYQNYLKRLEELKAASQKSLGLDEEVKSLQEEKKKLMSSIKLPIADMTLSDDGVRVGGIPFTQLAHSRRVKIGAEMGASINNELKIMRVNDGSLLDDNSFNELLSVAKRLDRQLWIESVGDGHGDAIHLEEGELRDVQF